MLYFIVVILFALALLGLLSGLLAAPMILVLTVVAIVAVFVFREQSSRTR